jgi:hypothetical protein
MIKSLATGFLLACMTSATHAESIEATQNGVDNMAFVVQGAKRNRIVITQMGQRNLLSANQAGRRNHVSAGQFGRSNTALVNQTGARDAVDLVQQRGASYGGQVVAGARLSETRVGGSYVEQFESGGLNVLGVGLYGAGSGSWGRSH